MSSHQGYSLHSSTPSSSALPSSSFYPRPVFASDLVAQKNKKTHASFTSPPINSQSSSKSTSSTQLQSFPDQQRNQNTMDRSMKLGDQLSSIHLPEFNLPDLQRLKQQLNKHTPSFSLKSLQHTFHVPSYTSYTSSFSSSSSSSSVSSSTSSSSAATVSTSDSAKSRLSFTSRLSLSSSVGLERKNTKRKSNEKIPKVTAASQKPITATSTATATATTTATVVAAAAAATVPPQESYHASSPISIPTHPSNYLVKKQSAAVELDSLSTSGTIVVPKASETKPVSASKSPVGHLFLQIIEARNLTLVNPPAMSRPYCLVEYDQNELITPPAVQEADTMGRRVGNDIFARAMAASSPKWRHDADFDVVRHNQQISITIYDSETEDNRDPAKRFLGQVKLSPSEIHKKSIDSWFRLQGREANEHVTGEIRVAINYQAVESRHLSTTDFDILRVLGVGSFGKVYQVRKKDTGRIYAMKVLDKKQVIEQKQVEHTIAERNVLIQALQSPFIVGLKFSFQTATKLYLVQDFMNGGELFFHMQNEGTFSEPRARFYAAELVLALEHLHSRNVVYRDLKPENVLLSSQGHLVLVDFGLCKQNVTEDERTHTFCGTTEYLAPEIIKGTGYGKAVDWWSLGVLLYEMLVGATPFADNKTESTHHKILHQPVVFPKRVGYPIPKSTSRHNHNRDSDADLIDISGNHGNISRHAQDLIQKLLDKNPKTRLGSESGSNGADAVAAIKAHPFFQGIDFVRLQTRDVTPPFQPHVGVTGDLDVSNFDAHFTDQKATLNVKNSAASKVKNATSGSSNYYLSSPPSTNSTTFVDGQAGSFMLQQQQRAANLYRQQQRRADNSTLSPNVSLTSGRRSNSWSSYRSLSNESMFSIGSEPNGSFGNSSMQIRSPPGNGGFVHPLNRRGFQQQQKQQSLLLQQQQQQQQQQRQQEYFKGFTFEGESVLEAMKRQDDYEEAASSVAATELSQGQVDLGGGISSGISIGLASQRPPNQLFSGEPGSIDSIFGSM
ncbi:hypothetical protein BGX27_002122 [Mortierella sp. AM989]|nr:hypothetical protein BGX27_002122 [Mortierella sp. AM989]